MRVKDCMCTNVVSATPDKNLNEIAKLMQNHQIGCIPICNNEQQVVGFVTDRDIITRCVAENKVCGQTKVSDVMTTQVIKITPDMDIEAATRTMAENQIKRLPVIEKNKLVGILSVGDLANSQRVSTEEVGDTVEQICKCEKNNG